MDVEGRLRSDEPAYTYTTDYLLHKKDNKGLQSLYKQRFTEFVLYRNGGCYIANRI